MTVDASLIDRLGAAALDGKQVVRDLHAAVKDARAVLKEIAAERERVETMVKRAVEDEIEEAVKPSWASLPGTRWTSRSPRCWPSSRSLSGRSSSAASSGPIANTFDLRKLAAG